MTDAEFLFRLIVTGGILLNFVGQIVAIVVAFKRTPPFPEEAYQRFVTRDQCAATHAKSDRYVEDLKSHTAGIHAEIFGQIRETRSAFEADLKPIERAIGRLEGAPAGQRKG